MKIFFSFLTLSLTFSSLVSAEIFDWDQNKDYNAGVTVVVKEGNNAGSYRSLQSVSAGTPITSTDYWYNLFLESNLPDYVQAGENPDQDGLNEALSGGTPNIEDIPEELPPNTDTSTGGGDTSTGGGDTSTGGGDTNTGGGDTSTGGGDTNSGGGDTNSGGGDTNTGGDTSTGNSVSGDLNGDGIPDIVWQKSGTNETKFWFMNTDGTKKSELDLVHSAGAKWRLSSTGDMDNDGNIDLLWQEENGATVYCYYMDGSGGIIKGTSASLASGVAPGWRFVSASGDYNGDGNVDLLWHSTTKGSTVCWHFNGQGKVSAFSPLGSKISDVFNSYAGHDMNSDGDADVIYHNANNGKVVVWYFNDSRTVIGTKTYFEKDVLDASLKVVGAKDYDNDGGVDILLQHTTTGVAKIVYFNTSGTQLSEKEIGTVGSTWEIRN